jgi:hypothetical protein
MPNAAGHRLTTCPEWVAGSPAPVQAAQTTGTHLDNTTVAIIGRSG